MNILPVIDLLGGVVVRGVGGRRAEYRPIENKLCHDPSPASVAKAFRTTHGFDTCYLADLDAIAGTEPGCQHYDAVIAAGLQPWIDAGTGDAARAAAIDRYLEHHAPKGRVVVGLESLVDADALTQIVATASPERIVFSLDLRHGRPITNAPTLKALAPLEIAAFAIEAGIRSLIVLDLASVGMNAGVPTLELCRTLRKSYPQLELTSGGGVRTRDDLQLLAAAGCDRALVSTALHDQTLFPTKEGLLSNRPPQLRW